METAKAILSTSVWGNEDLYERKSGRGTLRKNSKNVKKAMMDGLHDCEDTFNLCKKLEIMTPYIEAAKPTSTLGEAARIMRDKHIHRLLIFSEQGVGASHRPIGIISASDIIREAARN